MPETVELRIEEDMSEFDDYRIEGVIKAANKKAVGEAFNHFLYQWQGTGTIVTNPDPTGMVLVQKKDFDDRKRIIDDYAHELNNLREKITANNEVTKNLTAQLEQKANEVENWKFNYDHLHQQYTTKQLENQKQIQELETKLRLKENTLAGRIVQKLIWAGVGAIAASSTYYISQQL